MKTLTRNLAPQKCENGSEQLVEVEMRANASEMTLKLRKLETGWACFRFPPSCAKSKNQQTFPDVRPARCCRRRAWGWAWGWPSPETWPPPQFSRPRYGHYQHFFVSFLDIRRLQGDSVLVRFWHWMHTGEIFRLWHHQLRQAQQAMWLKGYVPSQPRASKIHSRILLFVHT